MRDHKVAVVIFQQQPLTKKISKQRIKVTWLRSIDIIHIDIEDLDQGMVESNIKIKRMYCSC